MCRATRISNSFVWNMKKRKKKLSTHQWKANFSFILWHFICHFNFSRYKLFAWKFRRISRGMANEYIWCEMENQSKFSCEIKMCIGSECLQWFIWVFFLSINCTYSNPEKIVQKAVYHFVQNIFRFFVWQDTFYEMFAWTC